MTIPTGKCPKCEQVIFQAEVEPITVQQLLGPSWNGASFLCPHCRTVLSVGMDPVALKTDIVDDILEALGKG